MNILFICGSAEPGKDGVGDYIRRLCGELSRIGHQAQILSLCDKHADLFFTETQFVEGSSVIVSRIPMGSSYNQQMAWSQEILNAANVDWISLQFVPYSFDSKGLPFWLSGFLNKLKGKHQWHFMFHELWIGIEREATFKKKCVGFLQKKIIQKLEKSIAPKVVHTQSKIYQHYLSKVAIISHYLPLFGNVSVTASKSEGPELVRIVVFATIHDKAPFEDFIIDLKKELEHLHKESKFVFIGRHGAMLGTWTNILELYAIEYELLGASSEEKISEVLTNSDYGISSTPYKISDKSGVLAAMREHQLAIISVAKPWIDQEDIPVSFDDIIQYQKENLSLIKPSETGMNSLSSVCDVFLKSIRN
ncbi:hypothetical protein ACM55M_16885 [Flavobacterium sp. ZT3R25]|uniref:hypothetical protein n=1 Tax=Flavobacterium galactosi TaxID=3398735 RepID=UPI003A8A2E29